VIETSKQRSVLIKRIMKVIQQESKPGQQTAEIIHTNSIIINRDQQNEKQ
jgi:hypothetical protein